MDVRLEELNFGVNPSQAEIDASLPLLVSGLALKSKPALENVLVSELLDINESLTKEVVLVCAIIFVKDVHLYNFVFSSDIEGAFFFPDWVQSAFLDLGP